MLLSLQLICQLVPSPARAGETGDGDLAGTYKTEGVNRDGSTYAGTLNITARGHNLYELRWNDPDSGYWGQGSLVGSELYAVWGSESARCLIVFFRRDEDGTLDGTWFWAHDSQGRGRERAMPDGGGSATLAGRYTATGTVPSGAGYERALEITPLDADYYRFRWHGEQAFEGIGELAGDEISVVASLVGKEGQCGKSIMKLQEDGSLSGTWTMNDDRYRVTGSERDVPE